jgi:hypothetical protein
MNRFDLMLADLKAKQLFRRVMEEHTKNFAPPQAQPQQPQEAQNVPTPESSSTTDAGRQAPAPIPPSLPQ